MTMICISSLSYTIDPPTPEDLRDIAELHVMAFPGFFLTKLGPLFLKAMYLGFMRDKLSVFFMCKNKREGTRHCSWCYE